MNCPRCKSNRVALNEVKEYYDCFECGLYFSKYNLLNNYYKFLNEEPNKLKK